MQMSATHLFFMFFVVIVQTSSQSDQLFIGLIQGAQIDSQATSSTYMKYLRQPLMQAIDSFINKIDPNRVQTIKNGFIQTEQQFSDDQNFRNAYNIVRNNILFDPLLNSLIQLLGLDKNNRLSFDLDFEYMIYKLNLLVNFNRYQSKLTYLKSLKAQQDWKGIGIMLMEDFIQFYHAKDYFETSQSLEKYKQGVNTILLKIMQLPSFDLNLGIQRAGAFAYLFDEAIRNIKGMSSQQIIAFVRYSEEIYLQRVLGSFGEEYLFLSRSDKSFINPLISKFSIPYISWRELFVILYEHPGKLASVIQEKITRFWANGEFEEIGEQLSKLITVVMMAEQYDLSRLQTLEGSQLFAPYRLKKGFFDNAEKLGQELEECSNNPDLEYDEYRLYLQFLFDLNYFFNGTSTRSNQQLIEKLGKIQKYIPNYFSNQCSESLFPKIWEVWFRSSGELKMHLFYEILLSPANQYSEQINRISQFLTGKQYYALGQELARVHQLIKKKQSGNQSYIDKTTKQDGDVVQFITKGFFDSAGVPLDSIEYQMFRQGNPSYRNQNYYYSKFFENYQEKKHDGMVASLYFFITFSNAGENIFEFLINGQATQAILKKMNLKRLNNIDINVLIKEDEAHAKKLMKQITTLWEQDEFIEIGRSIYKYIQIAIKRRGIIDHNYLEKEFTFETDFQADLRFQTPIRQKLQIKQSCPYVSLPDLKKLQFDENYQGLQMIRFCESEVRQIFYQLQYNAFEQCFSKDSNFFEAFGAVFSSNTLNLKEVQNITKETLKLIEEQRYRQSGEVFTGLIKQDPKITHSANPQSFDLILMSFLVSAEITKPLQFIECFRGSNKTKIMQHFSAFLENSYEMNEFIVMESLRYYEYFAELMIESFNFPKGLEACTNDKLNQIFQSVGLQRLDWLRIYMILRQNPKKTKELIVNMFVLSKINYNDIIGNQAYKFLDSLINQTIIPDSINNLALRQKYFEELYLNIGIRQQVFTSLYGVHSNLDTQYL